MSGYSGIAEMTDSRTRIVLACLDAWPAADLRWLTRQDWRSGAEWQFVDLDLFFPIASSGKARLERVS